MEKNSRIAVSGYFRNKLPLYANEQAVCFEFFPMQISELGIEKGTKIHKRKD